MQTTKIHHIIEQHEDRSVIRGTVRNERMALGLADALQRDEEGLHDSVFAGMMVTFLKFQVVAAEVAR